MNARKAQRSSSRGTQRTKPRRGAAQGAVRGGAQTPKRRGPEPPASKTTAGTSQKPAASKANSLPRRPGPPPKGQARLALGSWLFTCREGAERDVCDELLLRGWHQNAVMLEPALVVGSGQPAGPNGATDLAFVRQGFRIRLLIEPNRTTQHIAQQLSALLQDVSAFALQVWTPDSSAGNAAGARAQSLQAALVTELQARLPESLHVPTKGLSAHKGCRLVQACLLTTGHLAFGVDSPARSMSLTHGGRSRVHVTGDLPSRSARKLEEALQWLGVSPGAGDLCVDLGAAPGGWTYVLCGHGARVIAVDLASLRPDLETRRNVVHVRQNAFQFVPEETCDWLFCDMAYRPLEVAALLAKWGRNRWARFLVANIKLPMTKKAEILARVKQILEKDGTWHNVRAKQLYHDRDEVTFTGYLA